MVDLQLLMFTLTSSTKSCGSRAILTLNSLPAALWISFSRGIRSAKDSLARSMAAALKEVAAA